MLEMFRIAEDEGVVVKWCFLEPPILGFYWDPGNVAPLIALDHALDHNTPLARSIMAEELGHHFTTPSDALTRTYFHYRDRLEVSRAEYRALRWAALYLMPQGRIEKAIEFGCTERWSLASYFNVTEQLVDFRIQFLKKD